MAGIAKTPAILSSEIIFKSTDYAGWFILLEGDFDQRFWTSRLNVSNLRPINCVGKPNVLGTINLLASDTRMRKIVALADKDYDEVLSRLLLCSELIYTDKNDLEVTLLHCPSIGIESAMERILEESIDNGKRQQFEAINEHSVIEHLRRIAVNYGVLRLINEELQCCVEFDKLPIRHNNFLDHAALRQNKIELQNAFVDAANRVGRVLLTQLNLATKIEQHKINDLLSGWKLVQGHDLIQLLSIAINSIALKCEAGHRQVSEESLARDLCLMIHRHDLQTTRMFQSLLNQANMAGMAFLK